MLSWILGSHHTAVETERLIGTLNHVCLVVPEGHSQLVSLYKFHSGFKINHASEVRHKLSFQVADDIEWWRCHLQDKFVEMRIMCPPKPLDTKLFVDASTEWGIGLTLNGKWLAWQMKDGWNSEGHDISWAEMVAVELEGGHT